MQTQAATHSLGRSSDAAQTVAAANSAASAKMLALGAGGNDFLSMLVSSGNKDDSVPTEQRTREKPEDDRPVAERRDHEPQGTAVPAQPQTQPQAASQANAAEQPEVQKTEASKQAPPGDTAQPRETAQPTRDSNAPKAAVEPAAVESRPRTALAAGTSQAALAAQDQGEASLPNQVRSQTDQAQAAKTDSLQAGQRPDVAQVSRTAAQGREQSATGQSNTTLAGLEAMAQGKQAEKAQTAQAGGSASQTTAHTAAQTAQAQSATTNPEQLAQTLQTSAQAAERAQTAARGGAVSGIAATAGAAGGGAAGGSALPTALAGADGLTGSGQTAKLETTTATKPAAQAARLPQPAVDQVAVRIQKAAAAGQDRIQIKLNPAELGRVDVKLDFQADGGVRAVVSVERPETFDLLQRDARSLERALHDAGFKGGQTDLSFEMQTGGQGQNFADDGTGNGAQGSAREDSATAQAAESNEVPSQTDQPQQMRTASDGRVDLRA
ncbi:MAG: flagellar hook-length control protein FliK [Kiloniellales bacterium]